MRKINKIFRNDINGFIKILKCIFKFLWANYHCLPPILIRGFLSDETTWLRMGEIKKNKSWNWFENIPAWPWSGRAPVIIQLMRVLVKCISLRGKWSTFLPTFYSKTWSGSSENFIFFRLFNIFSFIECVCIWIINVSWQAQPLHHQILYKKCFSSKTLNKIFYVQRKISPQKNGLLSDRS